jgi:hypothetical protein
MNITEENVIRMTLMMTREEAQHLLECLNDSHAVSGYYDFSDDMDALHSVLLAFIKESPRERSVRIYKHNRLQRLYDRITTLLTPEEMAELDRQLAEDYPVELAEENQPTEGQTESKAKQVDSTNRQAQINAAKTVSTARRTRYRLQTGKADAGQGSICLLTTNPSDGTEECTGSGLEKPACAATRSAGGV